MKLNPFTGTLDFSGSTVNFASDTLHVLKAGDTMTGPLVLTPSADSTALFKITNAASTNTLFKLDSSTTPTNLIDADSASFENISNPTGSWVGKGSATIAQTTASSYFGAAALRVTTTAAIGDGITLPITLSAGAKHISFYMRLTSGSGAIVVGYAFDGSDETTELSNTFTPTTNGWVRVQFSFTSAVTSGTPYIFIKQTTATVKVLDIDGVLLTASNANITPPYYEGQTVIGGPTLITSPLLIKPAIDSSTTFGIMNNQSGRMVFQVSTTGAGSGQVLIGPTTTTTLVLPPPGNVLNVWSAMGFLPFGTGAANTAGINFYDGASTQVGAFTMEANVTTGGASGDMFFQNRQTVGGTFFEVGGTSKATNTAFYIDNSNRQFGIGQFTTAGTKPSAKLHILGDADIIQEKVAANATQTSNLVQWIGTVATAAVDGTGAILPASMADGSAPNSSVYYSTTASKLVFKNSGGVVNNLY